MVRYTHALADSCIVVLACVRVCVRVRACACTCVCAAVLCSSSFFCCATCYALLMLCTGDDHGGVGGGIHVHAGDLPDLMPDSSAGTVIAVLV